MAEIITIKEESTLFSSSPSYFPRYVRRGQAARMSRRSARQSNGSLQQRGSYYPADTNGVGNTNGGTNANEGRITEQTVELSLNDLHVTVLDQGRPTVREGDSFTTAVHVCLQDRRRWAGTRPLPRPVDVVLTA
jgi:hypothetical protein